MRSRKTVSLRNLPKESLPYPFLYFIGWNPRPFYITSKLIKVILSDAPSNPDFVDVSHYESCKRNRPIWKVKLVDKEHRNREMLREMIVTLVGRCFWKGKFDEARKETRNQVWKCVRMLLRLGLKRRPENYIFWPEIESGFRKPSRIYPHEKFQWVPSPPSPPRPFYTASECSLNSHARHLIFGRWSV